MGGTMNQFPASIVFINAPEPVDFQDMSVDEAINQGLSFEQKIACANIVIPVIKEVGTPHLILTSFDRYVYDAAEPFIDFCRPLLHWAQAYERNLPVILGPEDVTVDFSPEFMDGEDEEVEVSFHSEFSLQHMQQVNSDFSDEFDEDDLDNQLSEKDWGAWFTIHIVVEIEAVQELLGIKHPVAVVCIDTFHYQGMMDYLKIPQDEQIEHITRGWFTFNTHICRDVDGDIDMFNELINGKNGQGDPEA